MGVYLINNPDCRVIIEKDNASGWEIRTELSPEEVPYVYIMARRFHRAPSVFTMRRERKCSSDKEGRNEKVPGGGRMYPKRKAKSDRERFLESFKKKVGCAPEVYVRRKLAAGMQEEELAKRYDMLAIEIARRASCTAIRYADVLKTPEPKEVHRQKAASFRVPVCEKCGANMVLRTGQSGARKGKKFWGCSNYPACRYTKNIEEKNV